jgi:hypothetical protein
MRMCSAATVPLTASAVHFVSGPSQSNGAGIAQKIAFFRALTRRAATAGTGMRGLLERSAASATNRISVPK